MDFPNFFTEINKYRITLDFQDSDPKKSVKTYDLIYEIYEFELLKNQDKEYVKKLRKNKIKVKPIKRRVIENKKFVYKTMYYKLYSYHKKPDHYINKRVEMVLNKKIKIGRRKMTNIDYISEQINKIIPVTKKSPSIDKYSVVFDIIGTYLLRKSSNEHIDLNERKYDIPIEDLQEYYRKKRLKRHEKNKINKEKHKKWLDRNKKQVNRWKNSDTYRFNKELGSPKLKSYWESIGLIDPSKKCIIEWCIVDTDNKFTFNDKKYQISETCKRYRVENKISEKNLKAYENKSEMDKILVYYMPEKNEFYFFDQCIKSIDNKLIQTI